MGMTVIAMKKLAKQCFEGEITMPKVNLWMAGAICLLAGMVFGLLHAPLTHGIRIGCNNGNNNGNTGRCEAEKRGEGKACKESASK